MAKTDEKQERSEEEPVTERGKEREQEDEQYVPVIVKRTDEAGRHPDDTLERAVKTGLEQHRRPALPLVLSSMAAGLILGFSAMSVGVAATVTARYDLPLPSRLATALVYPLGFIMCIMSGAQLFTEHTATAVYPVLDRRASILSLLRLWCVVVAGNLAGAGISSALLALAEPVIGARQGYAEIVQHLVEFEAVALLGSSVLAGWLMALGAWLMLGTPYTSGQILSIYIVTFVIGLGGLHHSIAGAAEMFTGLWLSDRYNAQDATRFLALALAGNLIGGSIFVALLNYGHIRGVSDGRVRH